VSSLLKCPKPQNGVGAVREASAGHLVPYSSTARVQRGGSDIWLCGAELCFANGASSLLKAFKTAKKKGTIPGVRSRGSL